jgi:hypothetical protein
MLAVPDAPGLGLVLDPDKLRKYATADGFLDSP